MGAGPWSRTLFWGMHPNSLVEVVARIEVVLGVPLIPVFSPKHFSPEDFMVIPNLSLTGESGMQTACS